MDNNCITKSLEAVEEGNGGTITYKDEVKHPKMRGKGTVTAHIISTIPVGLQSQLNKATKDPSSGIKNVAEDFKK